MQEKIKSLLGSRRFWAVASGLIVVVTKELGIANLDETQVTNIAMLIASWVLGESLRSSESVTAK
jgi:hypothetical protein